MEIFGWIIVALIIAVPLFGIVLYNRLVGLRNQVKNAWRQIDVQLKRRHDLIPNLVEVVRDYMSYEQETLEKVIQARNQAVSASTPETPLITGPSSRFWASPIIGPPKITCLVAGSSPPQ